MFQDDGRSDAGGTSSHRGGEDETISHQNGFKDAAKQLAWMLTDV